MFLNKNTNFLDDFFCSVFLLLMIQLDCYSFHIPFYSSAWSNLIPSLFPKIILQIVPSRSVLWSSQEILFRSQLQISCSVPALVKQSREQLQCSCTPYHLRITIFVFALNIHGDPCLHLNPCIHFNLRLDLDLCCRRYGRQREDRWDAQQKETIGRIRQTDHYQHNTNQQRCRHIQELHEGEGHRLVYPSPRVYCISRNISVGKNLVNIRIGWRSLIVNPAKFSVGVVASWKLFGVVISLWIEPLWWSCDSIGTDFSGGEGGNCLLSSPNAANISYHYDAYWWLIFLLLR